MASHYATIKWKHFPHYWSFGQEIHQSLVNSQHKGQWCRALIFSLICAWINGWINNGEAIAPIMRSLSWLGHNKLSNQGAHDMWCRLLCWDPYITIKFFYRAPDWLAAQLSARHKIDSEVAICWQQFGHWILLVVFRCFHNWIYSLEFYFNILFTLNKCWIAVVR